MVEEFKGNVGELGAAPPLPVDETLATGSYRLKVPIMSLLHYVITDWLPDLKCSLQILVCGFGSQSCLRTADIHFSHLSLSPRGKR